jgi:2-dehydro-3-deoxyphosphogluconate aldolase/(4S)-4-hydroxy-2-oxoglutarate aldolase
VRDVLGALAPNPLIAILRAPDAQAFGAVTEVLYAAGFRCVEFTLTTAGAIEAMQDVLASGPDDLLVGMGTVRTVDQVKAAVDAGAHFLVSQVFRQPLVDAATASDTPFFPGALTPTEILDAWEGGVAAVKVSPIGPVGGLDYFDNVRGPLPDIPLMPTGGVEISEVDAYLTKGAVAVGLSGSLMRDALHPGGDLTALATRAQQAIAQLPGR